MAAPSQRAFALFNTRTVRNVALLTCVHRMNLTSPFQHPGRQLRVSFGWFRDTFSGGATTICAQFRSHPTVAMLHDIIGQNGHNRSRTFKFRQVQ